MTRALSSCLDLAPAGLPLARPWFFVRWPRRVRYGRLASQQVAAPR